eukprot:403339397
MSQWSGSQYKGPLENGWYQGFGKFFYPNGVVYEGNFDKGEFHGDGTLIYPNGGRYVAKWDRGKLLEGNYFFYDKLEYNDGSWDYCTIKDRSFYTEKLKGLRPDGLTLITNDIKGPKNVPQGTYDIGDGYYDPTKRALYEYDGSFKRDLDQNEEQWIVEKCRYQPKKYEDDSHLDGGGDKIIKEMIKLNQNPTLKQARESKGQ